MLKGTNKEKLREHGNIEKKWKGTREQGPPPGRRSSLMKSLGRLRDIFGTLKFSPKIGLFEHFALLETTVPSVAMCTRCIILWK